MRRLFKNIALEKEFREKGYVIIPFLNTAEVERMKKSYFDLLPQNMGHITPDDEGHQTGEDLSYDFTFINKNIDYKRACFDEISTLFTPKANETLDHYRPIIANFIRKETGDGEVPLHQNWAFANERKCTTVSVWCPLVDSNKANGTLQIIPGSHKKFGEIRGPMIPWELRGIEQEIVHSDLWDYMEIPAGHGVILDDGVIHYSAPNTTEGLRLAIQLIMIPQEESSIHYHMNPEKDKHLVEVLEVDKEFYMNFNPWKKPEHDFRIIDSFHFEVSDCNFEQFKQRLKAAPYDKEGNAYHFTAYQKETIQKEPLFKNPELEKEFDQNGFVKIPALDAETVEKLKAFYLEQGIEDEKGYGFHISMDNGNKEKVGRIMDQIFSLAVPQISEHFTNSQPYICSYVIKEPNPLGLVPSHQDWTFVEDEERHCSATVWIPLVDVTIDNGALGAIKGSHKFSRNQRPSPSPGVKNPLDPYMFRIFPYHQIVEMKAGEAFIFNNKTFHASPPNTTDETRLAIGIGFTQANAQLVHHYLDPITKDKVHKYKVDTDFFRKYDNATLTNLFNAGKLIEDYQKIGEYPYRPLSFDGDKLMEQIKKNGNEFNIELTEKLAKLFNYNMDGTKKEAPQVETNHVEDNTSPSESNNRSFWQTYTPMNILREIKYRISGK